MDLGTEDKRLLETLCSRHNDDDDDDDIFVSVRISVCLYEWLLFLIILLYIDMSIHKKTYVKEMMT